MMADLYAMASPNTHLTDTRGGEGGVTTAGFISHSGWYEGWMCDL